MAPADRMSHSVPRGRQIAANSRSKRRDTKRASCAIASLLSVVSSTSRLRSNRRDSSSRRAATSNARSRSADDSEPATTLTATNTSSATQFCESAMMNVPNGGMKK